MNCIIIHGCPDKEEAALSPEARSYDKQWYLWTKKQLELQGISTDVPRMPDPWEPNYERFKKEFEKYPVNEETILIGHSCGGAFLVRWLGETKQRVDKLILVAPWKALPVGDLAREAFYNFSIEPSIQSRVREIILFTSDNDAEEGAKESLKLFHEALGGRIIKLAGYGHFIKGDMGTEQFPELLEVIL